MVLEPMLYESFNQVLMTVGECRSAIRSEIVPPLIFLLLAMIFIAGLAFYHIYKYSTLKQFIKENKLEKKFQDYKNDNKGL